MSITNERRKLIAEWAADEGPVWDQAEKIQALEAENARLREELDVCGYTWKIDALRDENARLRAALHKARKRIWLAPHSLDCDIVEAATKIVDCNCWKSRALAAIDATTKP